MDQKNPPEVGWRWEAPRGESNMGQGPEARVWVGCVPREWPRGRLGVCGGEVE